jgi:glycosyltransferase involved in cell wall biosynthesis
MRTLQIGDDWVTEKLGGLGRVYYELLRSLPATGTAVQGLVVGSEDVTRSTQGQVVAFARPDEFLLTRLRKLRQQALLELDAKHVDLIVCHFALYGFPIADRLRSTPTAVHFQGPWAGESDVEGSAALASRCKAFVEQAVYARAKRLIVLSHAFQLELSRRYRIPEERIRVVPAGIDTDRFNVELSKSEARQRLGWPNDRPVLLTVRRLVRRMGLEDLIDAMKTVVVRQPDALLLLGGSGPIANDLRRRIAELGLERNVQMLGRIDDAELPMAYRAADLTVVPSQSLEGFGLITLESLASGTPVFVTPVGGLPEVVQPFASQCVFESASSASMSAALIEALRGERTLPNPVACRAYAVEGFTWPRIAARVRAVYDEAVGA